MRKNFHEHYEEEVLTPPSERSTGLVFAVVAAIIALWNYDHMTVLIVGLSISALFVGLALLAPSLMAPLNTAWFKLSLVMAKIVNPLVMGLLYYLVITPFGLVMQVLRDPLHARTSSRSRASHWIPRPHDELKATDSMKNQF